MSSDVMGHTGVAALSSAKAHLARAASTAFLINTAGTGLAFLSQLVLARFLGVEGYGIYAYVFAWTTILSLLATLGFQTGILRFASAYRAREEWPLLRGVLRYVVRRVGLAGLLIGIVTAGVVLAVRRQLSPELVRTFLVACAIVPVLGLLQVQGSVARAFGGVATALAPQNLLSRAIVLVVIGTWGLLFSATIEPSEAMAVLLVATVIALGCVIWAVRWLQPPELAHVVASYRAEEWRRVAPPLLFMATVHALLGRSDLLLLGALADTTSVGVYAVAARVADLVGFALTAVNVIFAPQIAALHARGDHAALQAAVTTTSWWVTLSALVIALPLFVMAELVLSLFGEAFTAGTVVLRILLVGQIVNAAAGSVGWMLTMTGHERKAAVVLGVAAAAQIAVNAVLISLFGVEGAAVGTMLTVMGWNLAMGIVVWRTLKIVPSILAWR